MVDLVFIRQGKMGLDLTMNMSASQMTDVETHMLVWWSTYPYYYFIIKTNIWFTVVLHASKGVVCSGEHKLS